MRGWCSRSLLPPFQACPLHYLSPLPALYQVRLQTIPSPLHLETAAETEHRTDRTDRQATSRQEKGRRFCRLPGRGRLEGEPGEVSTAQTGTRSAWRRGEQQVQVPGRSEERGPRRLWPPRYLDVLHKVININGHLPRIFRGPLDNHLLALLGVIGTGRLYLPDHFADDLEKRGQGGRAGEALGTELERGGFPGRKLGERQPVSSRTGVGLPLLSPCGNTCVGKPPRD